MGKKIKVRITEQELIDLITKQVTGKNTSDIIKNYVNKLLSNKPDSNDSDDDNSVSDTDTNDSPIIKSENNFTQLDLNTAEGYKAYKDISDKFINGRSSNLLNIDGDMLAKAAKNSYNQFKSYVPPELALAQLAAEGGFSSDPKSRPIRTKNPFNVGNIDSGKNVIHGSVQNGIQSYYNLISKNYLSGGKNPTDLINNFVNTKGQRYATNKNYENMVKQISSQVNQISKPIYASLSDKSNIGLA